MNKTMRVFYRPRVKSRYSVFIILTLFVCFSTSSYASLEGLFTKTNRDKTIEAPTSPIVYKDLKYDRSFKREIFDELMAINKEKEANLVNHITQKTQIIEQLGAIKYAIINGNLEKAKVEVLRMKYIDGFSKIIKNRYLSIIYFLEGKFDSSHALLKNHKFKDINNMEIVCHLKLLNEIILNKKSIAKTWRTCKRLTKRYSPTNNLWMQNIVDLRLNTENYVISNKIKDLKTLGYEVNFIKIYLKMALFMNQEELVLKFINDLPAEFFEVDEIREIMGHLYYRNGQVTMAFDFLEDLKTPNAENIKGNIYLAQKKYELAYAQFKLALKQKQNSYNAIERALPLSWILRQWNDGLAFSANLYKDSLQNKQKNLTLQVAFQTQLGEHKKAKDLLEQITLYSRYSQPFEVNQLYAYNSLILENKTKSKIYSDLTCRKLDAQNCWILLQTSIWEDFSKTMKRDEPVSNDSLNLLANLKVGILDDPIDEDIFVDQKDIEELDDDLIRLSTPH
jgi:hypothetical protein